MCEARCYHQSCCAACRLRPFAQANAKGATAEFSDSVKYDCVGSNQSVIETISKKSAATFLVSFLLNGCAFEHVFGTRFQS